MGRSSSYSDDGLEPLERTVLSDPLVGVHLGEYVIRERIGEGGMGIVYRGEQPLIGKQVAVKVLRPEVGAKSHHVERLLAEARAVNAIRHRGIIDIFSFGQTPDGRQYFVMEYLEGSALDAHLAEHEGLLPLREVLRLSDEILDALGAAHAAGVIHRDLKPNNIFLVRQSRGGTYVKVLDFGLAKQTSSTYANTPQTQQGLVMGTPEYMAPEQACAQPVSAKTDLYAFGVILFQMLTGQLPFTARSAMELLIQHVSQPPPSPLALRPHLPPELVALVLKLLAKAPEERPSMAGLRAELQRFARTLPDEHTQIRPVRPSKALPAPPRAPSTRRLPKEEPSARTPPKEAPLARTLPEEEALPVPRRSRSPWLMAVGAGALIAAGAAVLLFPRPRPQPVVAPIAEAQAVVKPPAPVPPAAPRTEPDPAPRAEAVAAVTGSAPVAAAQAEPTAAPVEAPPAVETPPVVETPPAQEQPVRSAGQPSRNTAQASSSSRAHTERNPLLVRIDRLEKKLGTVSMPEQERMQARRLLDKARVMARSAETPESRKEINDNLSYWEGTYLKPAPSASGSVP